jgi:hypothetical protein
MAGHGVPRISPNGELWVFNADYTEYMPFSIHDLIVSACRQVVMLCHTALCWAIRFAWLQAVVGHPTLFVFDCDTAGTLIPYIAQAAGDHGAFDAAAVVANSGVGAIALKPPPRTPSGTLPTFTGAPPTRDAEQQQQQQQQQPPLKDFVVFAACGPGESLPQAS